MSTKIIGYRAITHRATGRPMGTYVPVYADDWPYKDVSPSTTVFRYLDLWKFKDLCESSALYLCRADLFEEPLDGRLSKVEIEGTSKSEMAFRETYRVTGDYAKRVADQEVIRKCSFVACWNIATREDPRMWREYTTTSDSVLIATSMKRLAQQFPKPFKLSRVKYVHEDTPRTSFDNFSLLFYKDLSFSFERELRLLRPLQVGERVLDEPAKDYGRKMPVRLPTLIHRVITHPRISSVSRELVAALTRKYCRRTSLTPSTLSPLSVPGRTTV